MTQRCNVLPPASSGNKDASEWKRASRGLRYIRVRPLSNVENTCYVRGLTNLIYNRCSCTLFTLSSVVATICIVGVSLAGCGQARRERESELRLVNSL